jgi:L-iditol 2-dehydrogenase
MIAATYTQGKGFQVKEVPVPEIGEDELLVRVTSASICGTDLRTIKSGQRKLSAGQTIVLGHEFAGVVEKAGQRVGAFPVGASVGVAPNIGCGQCSLCVRGLPNMCPDYSAYGINIDGAHTEFVRIPFGSIVQGSVVPLPEEMPVEHAALIEPLSCAVSGNRSVNIQFGETVVVFGAGPIGLMHIMLAKVRGAGRIVSVEPLGHRLEKALTVGADTVINPDDENVKERVFSLTNGLGADAIVTACPVHAVQEMAVDLLAPFGRVCFFGGLPKDRPTITINSNAIHYKNLVVTGMTGGSPRDFRAAMALVAAKRVDLAPVVSHTFPIGQVDQAYETALKGDCMKVVLCN